MKRTLQFRVSENGYGYYENDNLVFEIKKQDLQFNIKEFYSAFYADDNDYEDIIVENEATEDKEATRIYDCVQNIFSQISEKLAELNQANEREDVEEDSLIEDSEEVVAEDEEVEDI